MFNSSYEKCINENVDIKLCAHEAFLREPSAGTLRIERLENKIHVFATTETKALFIKKATTYADKIQVLTLDTHKNVFSVTNRFQIHSEMVGRKTMPTRNA